MHQESNQLAISFDLHKPEFTCLARRPLQAVRCPPGQTPRSLQERLSAKCLTASTSKSTDFGDIPGTTERRREGRMIFLSLGLVLAVVVALHSILSLVNQPDVYQSYASGKCVNVIKADGTPGTCADLPDEYFHHWVK